MKTTKKAAPLRLTARRLAQLGACSWQRKEFRKVFPDGAPVTVAALRKAKKAALDVRFLWNRLALCPVAQGIPGAHCDCDESRDNDKLFVQRVREALKRRG